MCTSVRLRPSVNEQMFVQISSFPNWLFTLCARVLLYTVDEHVNLQFSRFPEGFVALCTSVWLLSSMNEQMFVQISTSIE